MNKGFGRLLIVAVVMLLVVACSGGGVGAPSNVSGTWLNQYQGVSLYTLLLHDDGGVITGDFYVGGSGPFEVEGNRNGSQLELAAYVYNVRGFELKGQVSGQSYKATILGCTTICSSMGTVEFVKQ